MHCPFLGNWNDNGLHINSHCVSLENMTIDCLNKKKND